jgi:cell shape-determining protein MreD
VFGTAPDLLAPLVLVAAARRERTDVTAALAVFCLGYLSDLFAGAPPGSGPFAYLGLLLVAKLFVHQIDNDGWWRPALFGAFAAAFVVALSGLVRLSLGGGAVVGVYALLAPRALLTAAVAPLLILLGRRLVLTTRPSERRGVAL